MKTQWNKTVQGKTIATRDYDVYYVNLFVTAIIHINKCFNKV